MTTIKFQLVTPEKTLSNKELLSISCNTELGQITILPNHIPLVANLVPGELITKSQNGEEYIYISGGFIQINPNSEVIILADAAEHYFDIDLTRAEEAHARAQKALSEQKLSDEDYAKVAAALERSLGRINIKRKHSHRKNPLTGQSAFKE